MHVHILMTNTNCQVNKYVQKAGHGCFLGKRIKKENNLYSVYLVVYLPVCQLLVIQDAFWITGKVLTQASASIKTRLPQISTSPWRPGRSIEALQYTICHFIPVWQGNAVPSAQWNFMIKNTVIGMLINRYSTKLFILDSTTPFNCSFNCKMICTVWTGYTWNHIVYSS